MSGTSAPVATATTTSSALSPAVTPAPAVKAATAVDEFIDVTRATQDVNINSLDLHAEFDRQPGLIFYYISMHAKAERQHSTLKLRLEATEASVAGKIRTTAAGAVPPEKLTVDDLKARVRLNATVVNTEQQVIKAKEVMDVIKAVVEALRNKKDMLVIKGHMTRDEMKASLDVSEQSKADTGAYVRDRDARLSARSAAAAAAAN
jgi:hypothetical protein